MGTRTNIALTRSKGREKVRNEEKKQRVKREENK